MQEHQKRATIYTREIDPDRVVPLRDANGEYPPELKKLLHQASRVPRPFDIVMVYFESVLGTPGERRDIEEEFAQHGISLIVVQEEKLKEEIQKI